MNLEVDGTKKIILVDDDQGLSLVTENKQVNLALSGIPVQGPKGDRGDVGLTGPTGFIGITTLKGNDQNYVPLGSEPLSYNEVARLLVLKISEGTDYNLVIGNDSRLTDVRTPKFPRVTFNNEDYIITASTSTIVSQIGTLGAPKTVTLPPALSLSAGSEIIIQSGDGCSSTNTLTIKRPTSGSGSSDTINGSSSPSVIGVAYAWRRFISDGVSSWTYDDGVLRASNNLSDLTSTSSARNALGLKGAAILDVGISGGVASYDDTRFSNSRNPSGSAGGALSGTYPNPSINTSNVRLDTVGVPSNDVSFNSKRITNLASIDSNSNDNDAATKLYVDQKAVGLSAKAAVRAATTGNITSFPPSGTQTIDGVPLAVTNRVLVKDQNDPKQNGIWIVNSGAWTRATDMDSWDEVRGAYVLVQAGSANIGTSWTSNVSAVTGTVWTSGSTSGYSDITFAQFSQSAVAEGPGISVSGSTISAKVDDSTIKINGSNQLYVNSISNSAVTGLGSLALKSTIADADVSVGATINVSKISGAALASDRNASNGYAGLTNGNIAFGQIPTGTTSSTAATGNHTHVFRTSQSFAIQGNVTTSDPTSGIAVPSFFAVVGFTPQTGQTSQTKLVKAIYRIGSGTSVTFDIRQTTFENTYSVDNWNAITNASGLSATTTSQIQSLSYTINSTDSTPDQIALYITGISGSPKNLTVTLVFEHKLN